MNTEEDVARETGSALSTLSVYMDGELPVEQRDRLLQSLKADAALRDEWLVYHCIGDVLRSEDAVPLSGGFGGRFKTHLDAEPFLFAPEVSKAFAAQRVAAVSRWRTPVAVAASVAAVVTAGLLVLPQRDTAQTARVPAAPVASLAPAQSSAPVLAMVPQGAATLGVPSGQSALSAQSAFSAPNAPSAAGTLAAAGAAASPGSASVPADAALRAVSSEYLMAHRHYSAGLAMRGVVSHVRTAGYDGQ